MATLPNVPGVIAVDLRYTLGADLNVNTRLHFRYTGGAPTPANLTDLATAIEALYNTDLRAQCASDVILNELWCQDLSDMTKPLGIWAGSVAGTAAAVRNMPASICAVASYRIARRYRGGHPRGYWPLFNANDAAGGKVSTWLASSVTALGNALGTFCGHVAAIASPVAMGQQCSVSYYSGVDSYTKANGRTAYRARPRAVPLVDNVTGIVISGRMGSQRRRLHKA